MCSGCIEEDLARVTTAKIGASSDSKYSVSAILKRLRIYRFFLRLQVLSTRDSNALARVSSAIDSLETDVSDGTLRRQPFCVMLYGFPGTGKSSLAIQIAKELMTDLTGEFKSLDMVTLNETDEYQSEFRTSHKVVLFDDIGASRYGLTDTKNPWRKVIDFVNNIKKTALNPNVEMKGKVYITPEIVILTSNLDFSQGGAINQYIPAAEAIFRRMNFIIRVNDYSTVSYLSPVDEPEEERGLYMTRRQTRTVAKVGEQPIKHTRAALLENLKKEFREHRAAQTKFVNHFNSYFDDYKSSDLGLKAESMHTPDVGVEGVDSSISTTRPSLDEAMIDFYLDRVDWVKYLAEHYYALSRNTLNYTLLNDGTVRPCLASLEQHSLNVDLFNVAYQRKFNVSDDQMFEAQELPDNLRAEGYLSCEMFGGICERMSLGYKHLLEDRSCADQLLPKPFCSIFEYDKKDTVILLSYVTAYCAFACYLKDWDPSHVLADSAFKSASPLKLPKARKSQISTLVRKLLTTFKKYQPEIFINKVRLPTWSEHKPPPALISGSLSEGSLDGQTDTTDEVTVTSEVTSVSKTTPLERCELSSGAMFPCEKWQIRQILQLTGKGPGVRSVENMSLAHFGEIDLVVEAPNSILVFECKSTVNDSAKAKAQAYRYARVMSALYPLKRVLGITYTPYGFSVISDSHLDQPVDFRGFLYAIGYLQNQP